MTEFGGIAAIGEAFVAAAIDPSRWNAAMEVAAQTTGSLGAILVPISGGRLPLFPSSESVQRSTEAYVDDGWIARDLRHEGIPQIMRTGVASDLDFIAPDEMTRSPYYQEFLAPHRLRWFAGVKIGDVADVWCLSLQRTIVDGPFSPTELRRLAGLSRRLSSAAELARAFGFARAEAALQTFETSRSAAAMIDRKGEVIRLNPSAERLIGADIKIVGRRIVSFSTDATGAFDRALHQLIWSTDPEALRPPIALPRRAGRPIMAYLSRAPAGFGAFAQCRAFVVLVDLEARLTAAPGDLIRAFGLTPAEARLASRLLDEESIERAAANLAITYETARKTLKTIFAKTDTNRQGQLVALVARLARRRDGS